MSATPDPDDQPSEPERHGGWTACEQDHWPHLVEMEARLRAKDLLIAELRAQVRALSTGLCHESRHWDLEARLMVAEGEVRILSLREAERQAGDGGPV